MNKKLIITCVLSLFVFNMIFGWLRRTSQVEQLLGAMEPDDLMRLVYKAIHNRRVPTCQLDGRRYSPFDTKQLSDVVTSDTCHKSYEAKHTYWNTRDQTFTIKCKKESQIGLYNIGPYKYNNIYEYSRNWQFYPSSRIQTTLRKANLPIEKPPVSMRGVETVHTVCVDLKDLYSYHDYYANVVRDESVVADRVAVLRERKELAQPPDIRLIILPSTSREFFHRRYPNAHSYLKSFMEQKPKDFSVHEFSQLHITGYNAIPNMFALITGKQYHSMAEFFLFRNHAQRGTLPTFHRMLWDHLKLNGYITTMGEDTIDSEIGKVYGMQGIPKSFDTYPAYHKISHIVQRYMNNTFLNDRSRCPCVGNQFMSELTMNWAERHLQVYSDLPNFIATQHSESAGGDQTMTLDLALRNHLEWFVNSGRAKNTVVVVLSDRGLHSADVFNMNTRTAIYEHENPVMFWMLPDRFVTEPFLSNVDKLTTLKDVHLTLRDIASYPNQDVQRVSRKDALSLIHDTASSTRDCQSLLIPERFRDYCPDSIEFSGSIRQRNVLDEPKRKKLAILAAARKKRI